VRVSRSEPLTNDRTRPCFPDPIANARIRETPRATWVTCRRGNVITLTITAPGVATTRRPRVSRGRTNDNCLSNVLVGYAFLWEVRHAPTGEPG